jgi:hypothetical protein
LKSACRAKTGDQVKGLMKSRISLRHLNLSNFNSAKTFLVWAIAASLVLSSMCLPIAFSKDAKEKFDTLNTEPLTETKPDNQATIQKALSQLQDSFIENRGQINGDVAYYLNDAEKTVYFNNQGLTFALNYFDQAHAKSQSPLSNKLKNLPPMPESPVVQAPDRWVVKMDFVGANPDIKLLAREVNATTINNYKGKKELWQTGLKTYRKLIYLNVWSGIDLEYSNENSGLKYTFVVNPGADPNQIKVAYQGATDFRLNADGQLEIHTPAGALNDGKPYSFQEREGKQVEVRTAYSVGKDEKSEATTYGFQIGDYDKSQPLFIDPVFIFSGFVGGSADETAFSIGLDPAGNIYVAGEVGSSQATFPVAGGPDTTQNGSLDAFVAKINATGSGVAYCGYIGGAGEDKAYSIAVDPSGNAYITGYSYNTSSGTFPVLSQPDTGYNGGFWDAFVAKIDSTGALAYCGYIGGGTEERGYGIAVDSSGNAYVTGYTNSTSGFPHTGGPDTSHNGLSDCWVAKLNTSGVIVYCGYIGGAGFDDPGWYNSIAVDSAGNAYVTGTTGSGSSGTFPVTVGPDTSFNGGSIFSGDAFVAKINPSGSLVYCGYIGGSSDEQPYGIAVDGSGNAYITGTTSSTQSSPTPFPVKIGPDLTHAGGGEGFID